MAIAALSGWTSEQKHVVAASFLGWSLDAFDFFLLVFVLKDIAEEFQVDITYVTLALLLTLAMRPVGAFLFAAFLVLNGAHLLYSALGVDAASKQTSGHVDSDQRRNSASLLGDRFVRLASAPTMTTRLPGE